MKSNQTMMGIGAAVAIIIAIGVLIYFLKPGSQPPPTHAPQIGAINSKAPDPSIPASNSSGSSAPAPVRP